MKNRLLHNRRISVDAFDIGGEVMLISGRLEDVQPTRFRPAHGGPELPAGMRHEMILELEVGMRDFVIHAARAYLPTVPMEGCREAIPVIQTLVGLKITAGFTREVKQRLGGPLCCAHIVSLLLAMAPLATQGAAVYFQDIPLPRRSVTQANTLRNTCHMWRDGGPISGDVGELPAQVGEPAWGRGH